MSSCSRISRAAASVCVERVQQGFPDCIAYRGTKRIRIEFEYRSSSFVAHRHDVRKCDWLVCWIHDWPSHPKRLRVIELRQEYGLGFNVWLVPISRSQGVDYRETLALATMGKWTAPRQASRGDLILYYVTAPLARIRDLFVMTGTVGLQSAGWKPGRDYMAQVRRVCALPSPIHLRELRNDPVLKNAGFVRGGIQSRYRITAHWPELYWMIVQRNPSLKRTLAKYSPARLA